VTARVPAGLAFFPSRERASVKAVACELPVRYRRPFSRFFVPDLVEVLRDEGLIETISASTVWRILDDDALKPWRHRSWIYPRDEAFYERAAAVLDLYAGKWRGRALRRDEFVRGQRVEHEYERCGAWAYLAAWDVRRAKLFDRVEETTGIEPFGRLVDQVMRREPYRSARRVFWVVDGGSSHHRSTFPDRLKGAYRHAVAVFTPVHASWLNQVEIYFSIVERKALTPNDLEGLPQARDRLLGFGDEFRRRAEPFNWNFTRQKLRSWLNSIAKPQLETRTQGTRKHAA
jgi:hypothetical protein